MQFTKPYKEAIAAGRITTTFRTWRTPRAKLEGQYNIPPFGAIQVTGIRQLPLEKASAAAIRRAGFADRAALEGFLGVSGESPVYQVDFKYLGSAEVKRPDTQRLHKSELADITKRLTRMDSKRPWTRKALSLIAAHPATRAGDLAPQCDMDTPTFKRNVRKLKALGLTQSMETGYQLTPRGQQMLRQLGL